MVVVAAPMAMFRATGQRQAPHEGAGAAPPPLGGAPGAALSEDALLEALVTDSTKGKWASPASAAFVIWVQHPFSVS